MHVDESYCFIIQFINDKRSTIRKQAEMNTEDSNQNMENNKTKEDILNSPVEAEEIINAIQEIRKEELKSTILSTPKEQEINIDFIPIVSSEVTQNEDKKEPSNETTNKGSIKDIVVIFEKVVGTNLKNIDVVFEVIEAYINRERTVDFNMNFFPIITSKNEDSISNIERFYKEVQDIIKNEYFLNSKDEEVVLDFIPVVYDSIERYRTPASTADMDEFRINQIETVYEEVKILVEEQNTINELPEEINIKDYKVDFSNIKPKNIKKNNPEKNILNNIPTSIFYKEKELEMLRTLEAIYTFGDTRQTPLLLEYLQEEKEPFIREIILEILEQMHQKNPKNFQTT